MAILLNTHSDTSVLLRANHIFGRASGSVNTFIDAPNVSRIHARITWENCQWQLQDKSTNGTFVNGIRIEPNSHQFLKPNDIIQFGSLQSEKWQLVSDEQPYSLLIPENQERKELELKNLLALPDEDNPAITFFKDEQGNWLCETMDGNHLVSDGEIFHVSNMKWTFLQNQTDAVTNVNAEEYFNSAPSAVFVVSQNEEHVSLTLRHGRHHIELGNKVHHYLLLLLARKWLADKKDAVRNTECGWLDKNILCKELLTTEQYMNILIFRHRQHLTSKLSEDSLFPPILERRLGEIRLNCSAIRVEGGSIASQ